MIAPLDAAPPFFDPAPREAGEQIRVLVVAAYPALRAGLRALLSGSGRFAPAGEDGSRQGQRGPDVILAQVTTGTEVGELPARTPAVVLGPWGAGAAPHRGNVAARGWLPLGATEAEVLAALEAVALGLTVFAAEVLPAVREGAADGAPLEPLTAREIEVLNLVASGLPNKGIALRLGISEHTAKFHVGALLSKLGAASRAEAVTIAVRGGILTL